MYTTPYHLQFTFMKSQNITHNNYKMTELSTENFLECLFLCFRITSDFQLLIIFSIVSKFSIFKIYFSYCKRKKKF